MKTTTVTFSGLRTTTSDPLYQYDYGQGLVFADLDLPEAYEVHFSNMSMKGESTSQIGDENGVSIPDMYFLSGEDIFAWIYLHEGEDDGETVYKVTIPIKKRAQPTGIQPTPVQQDVITQAIAKMNEIISEYEDLVDDTLSIEGKAADAKATGDAIAASAVTIDDTLTQQGQAADAKATGDAITGLVDSTLAISGKAADSKKTGDEITDLKEALELVYDDYFTDEIMIENSSTASRGISNVGNVAYDTDKTGYIYKVTAGELIYLELNANAGSTTAVWEFTTASSFGSISSSNLVGSVHSGAFSDVVIVPSGALYIAVAQATGAAFKVCRIVDNQYRNQIEGLKEGKAIDILNWSYGWYNATGSFSSASENRFCSTNYIKIKQDEKQYVKENLAGYTVSVIFFDNNKDWKATSDFDMSVREHIIDVPSGAVYYKVQYYNASATLEDSEKITTYYLTSTSIEKEIESLPKYNRNCLSVAHQGYTPVAGEIGHCKIEAYKNAALTGFDFGECDIHWTGDETPIPVCSHDASFTDATTGNTIVISEKTYSELQNCDYYGGKIASFEDVVKTCKLLGLGLFIDQLDASWSNDQWSTIFKTINRYNMARNVVWLTVSTPVATKIFAWDKNAVIGATWSYTSVQSVLATIASVRNSDSSNPVIVNLSYSSVSEEICKQINDVLPTDCYLGLWTIDDETSAKKYAPYVKYLTSNKIAINSIYNYKSSLS